jgi:hypothetical protein
MSKILGSGKDFVKSLLHHWVWTLLFVLILAPLLVGLLTPIRAKLAGVPFLGKLFGGTPTSPVA